MDNKPFIKAQFGKDIFELSDFWPTNTETEAQEIPEGMMDGGCTYLSFPLSQLQQEALGTNAKCLRICVRKQSK